MSEVRSFHPLVADWLTANGYTHQHHVRMPIGGIADFVATKDGQTFIVECKVGVPSYRAIIQTLDYCSQIDDSLPMIFANEASASFAHICESKGIQFHVLDMSQDTEGMRRGIDPLISQALARYGLMQRFHTDMVGIMREVAELHDSISSCAIKDLWELCMKTNDDAPVDFISQYISSHPEYEDICNLYLQAVRNSNHMHSLLPHIYVSGGVNKSITAKNRPNPAVKMRHFYKQFGALPPSQTSNICDMTGYPYNFTAFILGIDSIAVGLFDDALTQDTINRVLELIPHHSALLADDERNSFGEYSTAVIILPYPEYRRVVDMPNRSEVYTLDPRVILYGAYFDRQGKMQIVGGFWAVES